jgi:hypothetical protein
MIRALMVSDNDVLNNVYVANLKIYTDTEVVIVKDHEECISLLEHDTNFNALITLSVVAGTDTALLMYQHLIEHDIDIPLVVVAHDSELEDEDVPVIKDFYDIQAVVKSMAKIMDITAKDMLNLDVPNYYPISIPLFYDIETLPCDVYLKKGDNYALIMSKGKSVDASVSNYQARGIPSLYVLSDMRLEFINYASKIILNRLENEESSAFEKMEVVEQGIEVVAESLFHQDELTEEIVSISKSCVESMKDVVSEAPQLKALLASLLANKSGFLYSHSILATYVSSHIVKEIEWGSDAHSEKVSFVLFFSDMFLVPIYKKYPDAKFEEDLLFHTELTDEEKEIVLNHANKAGEAIRAFPRCPMGADVIIKQHHGMTGGAGFATSYKDNISPLAKVVIVAEAFVEDMLRCRDEGRAFNDNIKTEIIDSLKDRFNKHTYSKIIEALESIKL